MKRGQFINRIKITVNVYAANIKPFEYIKQILTNQKDKQKAIK